MPVRSNDDGFAMTGSFSCMTLGALLTFDQTALAEKQNYVETLNALGNEVIAREHDIEEIVALDFERIVYVGSGSLAGLTREAQLKILELTAGKSRQSLIHRWASVMVRNHLSMKRPSCSVLSI